MRVLRTLAPGLAVLVVSLGGALLFAGDAPAPKLVRFGMARSMFRSADEGTVRVGTQVFNELIGRQVGIRSEMSVVNEAGELARRVDAGELDFGVIHGIEYAWLKERYAELKPLVLACNRTHKLKATILVHMDSKCAEVDDLKGKHFTLPRQSLNHVHLFLSRAVEESGAKPDGFFGAVSSPGSVETALDSLVDAETDATIVDEVAFEHYRQQKPVRAGRLKVLAESQLFPTAAIIYKPKTCSPQVAQQVQTGLVNADKRPITRDLLLLARLSRFSQVPADYEEVVTGVLKKYPQPFEPARFVAESEPVIVGGAR